MAYLVNVFVSVSRILNRGNQLITLTAATNPRPIFAERTAMCTSPRSTAF